MYRRDEISVSVGLEEILGQVDAEKIVKFFGRQLLDYYTPGDLLEKAGVQEALDYWGIDTFNDLQFKSDFKNVVDE